MDWYSIGERSSEVADIGLALHWQWIGNGLAPGWYSIGEGSSELAGAGLVMDWKWIGDGLALDWHQIDI